MKKETNWNTYLIVALVIIVAVGLYFMLSTPAQKEKPAVSQKEIILTLVGADCKDCFNISMAVDFIKQQKNLKLAEVKETNIEDAKELIEKYNLTKLPAVIITGEITNLTIPNFNKAEDALVFDKTPPPYYDVATKSIKGKVEVIQLEDSTCTDCFNISLITEQLEQAGVLISTKKTTDAKSEEGKQLITKYKIEKIPTLILSKDALDYEIVAQAWEQVGTQESDGMLVLRLVSPPYINLSTGKTEGLVNLINIIDENCTECFNVTVYKTLLEDGMKMNFKTEETIDVTSTKGKLTIKKYGIELVPTIIVSKEAEAYPNFAEGWKTVGTTEKDGTFVFRNVQLLKGYFAQLGQTFAYKNITSGKVLNNTEEAEIAQPEKEE